MIRGAWGQKLHDVFEPIEDPQWNGEAADPHQLLVANARYDAMNNITHPGERVI